MTNDIKRVLVLGATGVFGRRLVQRLSTIAGLDLIVSSRQQSKADALSLTLQPSSAKITPLGLDHRHDLAATLASLKPWAVIDASGPFQGADYRIPLAALKAGAHVIDLADAEDYLVGFAAVVDPVARAKGLVALSGVSSTPALSVAVVDELSKGWQRIDAIDMAITPDGHNDVGAAAVAGVMSYAGVLVDQFRHGRMRRVLGWLNSEVITVPGVGRRRVTPVETIDAQVMRERFRPTSRVAFQAGLESSLEQWGLQAIAKLRQWSVLKNPSRLVPWLVKGRNLTRPFAGTNGGMTVRVRGLDEQGTWSEAQWSLLAQNGDGPNVPALPAVAAIRLLLEDQLPAGARLAAGDIPLDRIAAEFDGLAISATRQRRSVAASSFETALGPEDYAQMPEAIRRFHAMTGEPIWEGRASVLRGTSPVARLVGWIIGLPPSGEDLPVRVSVERDAGGRERWTRNFDGREFHSDLTWSADKGLTETFGPLCCDLGLAASAKGTAMPVSRGWFLGIPLPAVLLPGSETSETLDAHGRFRFSVRITLPVFGLLVQYQGWLVPVAG